MPAVIDAAELQKNLPKYFKSAAKKPVFIQAGKSRRVLISEADFERMQPIYIFEDGSTIEPVYADDPDAKLIESARKEHKKLGSKAKTYSLEELKKELQL